MAVLCKGLENFNEIEILRRKCSPYPPHLILQTNRVLKEQIKVPADIPQLIFEVYSNPDLGQPLFRTLKKDYDHGLAEEEKKAKNFCLNSVSDVGEEDTIASFLVRRDLSRNKDTQVRDIRPSITLFLVTEKGDQIHPYWKKTDIEDAELVNSETQIKRFYESSLSLPIDSKIGRVLQDSGSRWIDVVPVALSIDSVCLDEEALKNRGLEYSISYGLIYSNELEEKEESE